MEFPLDYVRGCFPGLSDSGSGPVYLNGLAAPQSLGTVKALLEASSLVEDPEDVARETRESLASFLNSNASWAQEEILFASDVSDLARRLASALADDFPAGSNIIITDIDEDWHLQSWRTLEERGVAIQSWPLRPVENSLDERRFDDLLNESTRAVVAAKASQAYGTVVELLPAALKVRDHHGALVVNWTPFVAHGALDVRGLRADFVIASTGPLFGSKVGFLWGKKERLRELRDRATDPFEGLVAEPKEVAALGAVLRYVEELGLLTEEMQIQPSEDYGRRKHMRRGMQVIRHYERTLTTLALRKLSGVRGARVYGIADADAAARRTPNLYFTVEGLAPAELASGLAEENVLVGHGTCGCSAAVRSLGLSENEGAVSAAVAHYTSEAEVERFTEALHLVVRP